MKKKYENQDLVRRFQFNIKINFYEKEIISKEAKRLNISLSKLGYLIIKNYFGAGRIR